MTARPRHARFAELDAATLYALLKLRTDVFVVEQGCAYPELDGRDTETGTVHAWMQSDGEVLACLRLLAEPDGATRLGRVATAPAARGRGLGRALVRYALALARRPVVADVQAHLTGWYADAGFVVAGERFVEDGIPHVPMRLDEQGGPGH